MQQVSLKKYIFNGSYRVNDINALEYATAFLFYYFIKLHHSGDRQKQTATYTQTQLYL